MTTVKVAKEMMIGNMKLSGRPETQYSDTDGRGSSGEVPGGLPIIRGFGPNEKGNGTTSP